MVDDSIAKSSSSMLFLKGNSMNRKFTAKYRTCLGIQATKEKAQLEATHGKLKKEKLVCFYEMNILEGKPAYP